MKSEVQFINENLKRAFEELNKEDKKMYDFILRAFEDI